MNLVLFFKLVFLIAIIHAPYVTSEEEIEDFHCAKTFKQYESKITRRNGWLVRCGACDPIECQVYGNSLFAIHSHVCCAAIHNGTISKEGGLVRVLRHRHSSRYDPEIKGTYQNDVSSDDYEPERTSYWLKKVVIPTTPVPIPAAPTTEETTTTVPTTTISPTTTTISTTTTQAKPLTSPHATVVVTTNGTFSTNRSLEGESPHQSGSNAVSYAIIGGVVGAVAVVLIILMVFAVRRNQTSKQSLWKRIPNGRKGSGSHEGCVCYVATDSSQQSLMHDPETCERPCTMKKQLIADQEEEVVAKVETSTCQLTCEDCTGEHCSSQNEQFTF